MLCRLANSFPLFVEDFLDLSSGLSRRFREETVTDMFMSNLVAMGGKRVIVDFPDEPSTGADMEWNFVNTSDGSFLRLLVQAKRSYGNGKVWTRHSYKEIYHRSGKPLKYQSKVLCETARTAHFPTYPLYMLFTPGRTCNLARKDHETRVTGVALADGYEVEKLVLGATSRTARTSNASLKTFSQLMFPLSRLFCPTATLPLVQGFLGGYGLTGPLFLSGGFLGFAIPPTPQRICDVINRLSSEREGSGREAASKPRIEVGWEIPIEIQQAVETGRFPSEAKVCGRAKRAVFVSESFEG